LGIGFAIPSNMADSIMNSIIGEGRVDRGWLGVVIQDLTPDLAESFNYDSTKGVLIGDVLSDGPAEKAGIRAGDVIVRFDGDRVEDATELRNLVASTAPGTTVEIVVSRNGEEKTLEATLEQLDAQVAAVRGSPATTWGMNIQTLTPELARRAGVDEDQQGVIVTEFRQPTGRPDTSRTWFSTIQSG
jgi:serine protease Do